MKHWGYRYCGRALLLGLLMLAYSAQAWAQAAGAGPTWEIIAFAGFGLALSLGGMYFRGVVSALESRIERTEHRIKNHDGNYTTLVKDFHDLERSLSDKYVRKEDMRDMIQLAIQPMSQQINNLAQNMGAMREALSKRERAE